MASAKAPSAPKSYFKGLKEAKVNNRLPYFESGQLYKLRLDKTFVFETRDKGDAFIANFTILETTGTQKVGSQVAWYQGLVKNKDTAFGAIKSLMYALMGADPNSEADADKIAEIDLEVEDEMNKAIEENHMAGTEVKCQTVERIGKDSGKPYTATNWLPA